jgi:hypothetical protein
LGLIHSLGFGDGWMGWMGGVDRWVEKSYTTAFYFCLFACHSMNCIVYIACFLRSSRLFPYLPFSVDFEWRKDRSRKKKKREKESKRVRCQEPRGMRAGWLAGSSFHLMNVWSIWSFSNKSKILLYIEKINAIMSSFDSAPNCSSDGS